jgi:hypothetical protein
VFWKKREEKWLAQIMNGILHKVVDLGHFDDDDTEVLYSYYYTNQFANKSLYNPTKEGAALNAFINGRRDLLLRLAAMHTSISASSRATTRHVATTLPITRASFSIATTWYRLVSRYRRWPRPRALQSLHARSSRKLHGIRKNHLMSIDQCRDDQANWQLLEDFDAFLNKHNPDGAISQRTIASSGLQPDPNLTVRVSKAKPLCGMSPSRIWSSGQRGHASIYIYVLVIAVLVLIIDTFLSP